MPKIPVLETVTPTTDFTLPIYTNSILEAVNTCPMWGVIRYGHRKVWGASSRAMALEYGSLMHEVFSSVRIWQLQRLQKEKRLATTTIKRLYQDKERANFIFDSLKGKASSSLRDEGVNIAFNTVHSSGYIDDEADATRTVSNMEILCIRIVEEIMREHNHWQIYIDKKKKPAFVGIEHVFDVTLLYSDGKKIRFVGTADAVLLKVARKEIYLGEYKSGSRLSDAWRESFKMRHQITGYSAASTTFIGKPIFDARVYGVRSQQYGNSEDYVVFEEERKPEDVFYWGAWVRHTADVMERYLDDWENAPRYTHSCTRYFRPCSMIPFCHSTPDDRSDMFESMDVSKPSPSEQEIVTRGHAQNERFL